MLLPGACRQEGLAGSDLNSDGIRDDVAHAIVEQWEGDLRSTALQYANVL